VSVEARPDARTLAALIPLGIANHAVFTGSRVIVALDALSRGASPFTVGVLVSLYALLPMLLTSPASAGEPCQLDEIGTTVCTGDNSEYRVIRGTFSPDKRYGIAWNTGTGRTRRRG